ncbi:ABC transporter permease [Deminuibacter soli]|uniref:ABC transporter permease n=1 Tax=Deminuibacter soli TaxID=2291815 RepID=A0A3E1NR62_9BACT|nr:ABC transporter permease [Deminuibacter soli]RFM30387.1 ABC transporter permease [Deminuibacter soli]
MNSDNNHTTTMRKLLRSKPACFGLLVIALAFIIAVFAYFFAPDGSPFANRMLPVLANAKPGYSIRVVQVKRDRAPEAVSLFSRLLNGQASAYQLVPVTSCHVTGDSLFADKFVDEGVTSREVFALNQLAPEPVVTLHYRLGSDRFGRDILSRLLIGTRVSLGVGAIAVLISVTIGILLGALAGYFRGWVDDVVMWFINIIWSIPTLLLVFAITLVLGKGFWQVFIAVGLTMWVNVARLVRGQVLQVRELQYIEATRAMGFSPIRTIVHHIIPNIIGPVIVIAAGNFASAIVVEAGLSFLGVGVQPPQPSWGLMIKENYNFIITHNPMLALTPGIAIMLLVLAFNLLGNGLRDALDVREKV